MRSKKEYFENAVKYLPDNIKENLYGIEDEIKEKINEIRLRVNSPVALNINNEIYYLTFNGSISQITENNLVSADAKTIADSFNRLCNFSVYSHINDINSGFITIDNCDRVGVCGTAVSDGKDITSVKNITSLNIRIARQHKGCSKEIIRKIRQNGEGNILITGPPASGKTTILRDLVYSISSGELGQFKNISVIDARREIFCDGECFEKGMNTDVFSSYPKRAGIEAALRCMSPDYIVTDEATRDDEINAVCNGLNSGVRFILSLHSSSQEELKEKEIFKKLVKTAAFKYIVFLKARNSPGEIKSIISSDELYGENV